MPTKIILYVIGLVLLFSLCIWQIERGLEKQAVETTRAEQAVHRLTSTPPTWSAVHYRNVQLQGRWLGSQSFLLENRVYQGQVAFEVLTPFVLEQDQTIVMVNRGWTANPDTATDRLTTNIMTITGVIYQPGKGLQIGQAMLPGVMESNVWPKKSLYIDLGKFESALQQSLQSVILVLDENQPGALTRIWQATVISANKHFAYAFQWFGLGLTFLIYGVIWFRRRTNNKHETNK